jgi:DNA-binding NtrC family response regulator/tetratricopeptide (TPR) repeat protein
MWRHFWLGWPPVAPLSVGVPGQGSERTMPRPHLIPAVHPTGRLVGEAPAIVALRAQIRHLATFDTLGNPSVPTVLLHGETGTGKGLVARLLHDSGPRARGPFLEVNCAAIPETMLEAELFGFEAGAFTDAKRAKPGLLEAASGGTLFLDEIDALPLALQGKLLTVIEAKRVRRLGAVVDHPMDVKLTVATQADLQARIGEGRFRADLYHRLAVVLITVPPLRVRGVDMILLAQHYLQRAAEAHRLRPKRLSPVAEAWLQRYAWPGNVRELGNLMERVTLLSQDTLIGPEILEQLCLPSSPPAAVAATRPAEEDAELEGEAVRIQQALLRTAGNVARAARLLGMSRGALRHRMARYGITPSSHESRIDVSSPQQKAAHGEGTVTRQDHRRAVRWSRGAPTPTPGWEQKPVAVLAVEMTWPSSDVAEVSRYEPWTVTDYWEQAIIEMVQGFGGVVLPHAPSLVMVAFGIPQTLEQAPQRAVQAALALRRLVAEAAEGGAYPELRMAVHWGQVLVDTGSIDPTARLLPRGDTLARPGRLLGYAEPGEILASPEMERLVGTWCELRAREGLPGMGQPDQIGAYTIVGLRPPSSASEMHGQRPLSRFVGRERELATLEGSLEQARGGRGQVVGMIGEPGVGKSRLCYEFIRAHHTHSWLILETSADSYGQATPYLPVIDLLKSYFQVASRDDVPTLRGKVADKLRTLGQSMEPNLSALLTLLGVPVEDTTWQALDPPQRRQHILDALKRLLVRESQIQPILLVAENLHWIDSETQAFLDTLVEGLPTSRLLLLVSYRPEYQHGWGSKTYYTQLRLDPLPREHAQVLLDTLLGGDASLAPLTQSLWQRTAGNPFFLEESVQTLVDTQVLVGERGAYRLAKPLQSIQVPATVQAVLAARIDRLLPEEKRVLQTAAVIGPEVPFALLRTITELPEEALRVGLTRLQAAEFLYETRLFPEQEYTFKHALTHEVAYGSLLLERRRVLHARIVEALEGLAPDWLAEQVERLAHHALRSEVWDKALVYCRQAGEKTQDRAAPREAVAYFDQALQALAHLPAHEEAKELAVELRLALDGPLNALGQYERRLALLGEAEALARALGDRAWLVRVLAGTAQLHRITGNLDGAIAVGRQALELAAELRDRALQVEAATHLGEAYYAIGEFGRAAELLRRSVEAADMASSALSTVLRIRSRAWLALTLGELGEFVEGRRHGEEALRLATTEARGSVSIQAHRRLGHVYLAQGDLAHAIRVLQQGLDLCRASGEQDLLRGIVAGLGYTYTLRGRLAEGRALLEEGIGEGLRTGALGNRARFVAWLSEVCRLAGRGDEAWEQARQALDLSQQYKVRGDEALALFQLGTIQAHANPPDVAQAETFYQQALALATELGMRPLQAHCHFGLGSLYAKTGQREQARAELAAAIDLYKAMEMTFWLPQAEATLARVA